MQVVVVWSGSCPPYGLSRLLLRLAIAVSVPLWRRLTSPPRHTTSVAKWRTARVVTLRTIVLLSQGICSIGTYVQRITAFEERLDRRGRCLCTLRAVCLIKRCFMFLINFDVFPQILYNSGAFYLDGLSQVHQCSLSLHSYALLSMAGKMCPRQGKLWRATAVLSSDVFLVGTACLYDNVFRTCLVFEPRYK